MKKILVVCSLLAIQGTSIQATSAPPAPAVPPAESTDTSWRPYQKLPTQQGISREVSLCVDEQGDTHVARMIQDTDGYRIWYFNSKYETRSANGFSEPKIVATALISDNQALGNIDIAVSPDGLVHIVWSHGFPASTFTGNTYDRIGHKALQADGTIPSSTDWLTEGSDGIRFTRPQAAVTQNGDLHIVCVHEQQSTQEAYHIIRSTSGVSGNPISGSNPAGFPRFALRGTKIAAVWTEIKTDHPNGDSGEDVFYSVGTTVGGFTSPQRLTTTGFDKWPDVDVDDESGVPHFCWTKAPITNPATLPTLWYGAGALKNQISQNPNLISPSGYGTGGRIRLSGTMVHAFYDGFAHAVSTKGVGDWRHEERLHAPNDQRIQDAYTNETDPNKKIKPGRVWEVAEFRGRFDVIDTNFYTRTFDTIPDGASYVPAFPGGSVNLVPLSGSLQYRLNLFATKGVGPCTSLGLTYNTKKAVGSFNGPGWTMDHLMTVTATDDAEDVMLTLPNGLQFNFTYDPATGTSVADKGFGFVASIKKIQSTWKMTTDGGTEYVFDSAGKLGTVQEPTGNYLAVHQNASGLPDQIIDMLGNGGPGRVTQLIYGTGADIRHVVEIIDPGQRHYQLGYSATTLGYQLTSVTFPQVVFQSQLQNPVYSFQYGTNGLMSSVTTPRGNVYGIFYDGAGRVEHIEDPSEAYLLEGEGDQVLPDIHTAQFKVTYNTQAAEDTAAIGNDKFYTRVEDRRGNTSIQVFNAANNFCVTELWDAAALAQVPGIHPVVRTFDTFNNVLTQQDRWGFTTTYTYVQKGTLDPAPWLRNLLETVRKPDPSGPGNELVEEFTYTPDQFGNVHTHTTYAGGVARLMSYDYDVAGRLTVTHFPDVTRPDGVQQQGVTTTNTYGGPRLQLTQITNEENHITTYSNFHPVHGLAQSVLREGGTQSEIAEFDSIGNVTRTKRSRGGVGNEDPGYTTFGLDNLYRIATVTDPAGKLTVNGYDLESHLISVQPPGGDPTITTYDSRGFVSGGMTPEGSWLQIVNANGNVRRKSSIRGYFTYTDYDLLDRAVATRVEGDTTLGAGLGGGGPVMETQWVHDGFDAGIHFSLETRVGPPNNRITKTVFDNRHRATSVTAPDLKTVKESLYDSQDQVIAVQTLFNTVFQTATLTFRDVRDRVERVRVQDAPYDQAPVQKSDIVTILNRAGSVVQTVDPLGNAALPGYSHKTTNFLDARERVQFVVDGKGVIVRENLWGDDDLLEEVKIPDPASKSENLVRSEVRTYTARKELKTVLNRNNVGLTYSYNDIQGQVNTVTDALGRITKTTYYAPTQRVDEVIIALDPAHPEKERRTKSVWLGGLLIETRVWNPDPTSPTGNSYSSSYFYFYDKADRLERFEAPLVSAEQHSYTAFGEEFQFIAGSKTITNTYNILGQRISSDWSVAYSQTESRTYNGIGVLETVSNGSLRKTMLYDVWHGTLNAELFEVQGSFWKSQVHFFDEARNYRFMTDSENGSHEWRYDNNNRLEQIRFGPQVVCELLYTPGGLVDKSVLHSVLGSVIAETTHTYDGLGRKVRQQTVQMPSGQTQADFEWIYDSLDLVTAIKVNHLGARADLNYNERRELTQEAWTGNGSGQTPPPDSTVTQNMSFALQSAPSAPAEGSTGEIMVVSSVTKVYDFDPAGNRKSITVNGVLTQYSYNQASQLKGDSTTAVNSADHFYDEWGNESTRTTTPFSGPAVHEAYAYNYLNLLSDYTKDVLQTHEQYDYWPSGERYAKSNLLVNTDRELYIQRAGDVVTEYSDPATMKNRYVQGTGVDQKYTRITLSGDRKHYLGDSVGTVSVTMADSGASSETTLRDVWGVQMAGATSERYGFAQREHDQESGLVHMRARQYDPRTGRFNQTDPILGNRPGKHYTYASNQPSERKDPLGLDDWRNDPKFREADKYVSSVLDGNERAQLHEAMRLLPKSMQGRIHGDINGVDVFFSELPPDRSAETGKMTGNITVNTASIPGAWKSLRPVDRAALLVHELTHSARRAPAVASTVGEIYLAVHDSWDKLAGNPQKRFLERVNAMQELEAHNAELEYYIVHAGVSNNDPAVKEVRKWITHYQKQLDQPSPHDKARMKREEERDKWLPAEKKDGPK